MKILHIISSMNRGGRERQLSIITKYCKNINNQIIFYQKAIEVGLRGKVMALNAFDPIRNTHAIVIKIQEYANTV